MAGASTTAATIADRAGASAGVRVRSLIALCIAGLIALVLLAGCSTAHAASAQVSGAVANGFARLIFTFPEDVQPDVRTGSGILIISFKQPLDLAIGHLPLAVPGYIGAARLDPDGTGLRLALTRKVSVNTMAAGEKLFVDLMPEGWVGLPPALPQEVVDELARRAREAERQVRERHQQATPAPQQPAIRVRVATLPTFTRFTFNLPGQTEVSIDRGRDRLSLVFGAPLKFDLAEAKAALPVTVAALDAETEAERAHVRFTLNGKVDVRTFRDGGAFVVDMSPTGARDAATPSESGGTTPEWVSPVRDTQASPQPAPPQTSPTPASGAAATPNGSGGAPAVRPAASPAPSPQQAPATPHAAPPDENAPVQALLRRHEDTLRLVFPFRTRTAAAVFRRGDSLWLVFDSAVPVDVRRLKDDTGRIIRDVAVSPSGAGQAVRIMLERPRLSSMVADAHAWIVTLGDVVLEPTAPLTLQREKSATGQAVALVPFEGPQRLHRLHDVGGAADILAVTGHGPARGFPKALELVEFRTLASTHGVAIEPLADDVTVELAADRIVVSRPEGLAMTPAAAGSSADGPTLTTWRPVAIEPQSWGFDRRADFLDRRVSLMRNAGDAPEGRRTAARLDIARFYLARDLHAEAKGVLDVTIAAERDSHELATGLVLRGIANLLLGRAEQTLKDLASPMVGNQHDAPLWRGVALSRLGRFTEARASLKDIEAAATQLPVELQRVVLYEAARCAIEVGDLAETARRLSELEALGVPHEMRPAMSLLSGRLAEHFRRPDDALAAYRLAAGSRDQPQAAEARLRTVALRKTLRTIQNDDAIAELELLTAAWRGDDTEVEAMRLLARLYRDEGRHRDAFQLMRVALTAHARSQVTRRIQDEAAVAFEALFLGGQGSDLPAIEALGLFYDFRNLTPAGRRGDEMIRRLAERLIAMDLLTQAGELLQHQIDNRLQGAARAQVAARLAMVYLMNRRPDGALTALRSTRMNDLPRDVRQQRLLLEARALSDSGRHDLALEITSEMEGAEVGRLRADIHWAARHWREAAESIERLYGERWRSAASLDVTERTDILRAAIGYALAEDMLGVDRFREKYRSKMSETSDARMFEVVTAPSNARGPEFADIARAASSVDTLGAFLRDLRARYPDNGAVSAGAAGGSG